MIPSGFPSGRSLVLLALLALGGCAQPDSGTAQQAAIADSAKTSQSGSKADAKARVLKKSAIVADAERRKTWDLAYLAELKRLRNTERHGEAIALMLEARSPTDVSTVLDHTRDSILAGSGPSAYTVPYAWSLWRTGDPDAREAAVIWYYVARLRVLADLRRCAEEAAINERLGDWYQMLEPVDAYAAGYSPSARQRFLDIALLIDKEIPTRIDDSWLCAAGSRYEERYAAKHGVESLGEIVEVTYVDTPVRILPVDPDLVEVVDAPAWEKQRQETRETFLSEFQTAP